MTNMSQVESYIRDFIAEKGESYGSEDRLYQLINLLSGIAEEEGWEQTSEELDRVYQRGTGD